MRMIWCWLERDRLTQRICRRSLPEYSPSLKDGIRACPDAFSVTSVGLEHSVIEALHASLPERADAFRFHIRFSTLAIVYAQVPGLLRDRAGRVVHISHRVSRRRCREDKQQLGGHSVHDRRVQLPTTDAMGDVLVLDPVRARRFYTGARDRGGIAESMARQGVGIQ
jgi:hypothetical protein